HSRHRDLHSFPTRRSSDLLRSAADQAAMAIHGCLQTAVLARHVASSFATGFRSGSTLSHESGHRSVYRRARPWGITERGVTFLRDRKSTRLNSSHRTISYA